MVEKIVGKGENARFNTAQMRVSFLTGYKAFLGGLVENIVEKEENAGYQHLSWLPAFSPFPIMFSKGFFLSSVKSGHCKSCIDLSLNVCN